MSDMVMIKYSRADTFLQRQITIGERHPLPHDTVGMTTREFVTSAACAQLEASSGAGHARKGGAAIPGAAAGQHLNGKASAARGKGAGAKGVNGHHANGYANGHANGHSHSVEALANGVGVDAAAAVVITAAALPNGKAVSNGKAPLPANGQAVSKGKKAGKA